MAGKKDSAKEVPHPDASILRDAVRLRRSLHRWPEPSNHEGATAGRIQGFLARYGLRPWRTHVGNDGLAYRLQGRRPGPAIGFRADLDALPIHERSGVSYSSRNDGVHHACGHDGHSAMLAGAMAQLSRHRDFHGTLYAFFQPAEETGEGAKRFLGSLRGLIPMLSRVYGIHNMPGRRLGVVGIRGGTAARPSMGLEFEMIGRRAHASEPEMARNPIPSLAALARLIQSGPRPVGGARRAYATIVGFNSGDANYGVSPGSTRLALTLRGTTQRDLDRLRRRVVGSARRLARRDGLRLRQVEHDVFRETRNDLRAVRDVVVAARRAGLPARTEPKPLAASEDFGRFTERWTGALILLGAGTRHAPLHAAEYDFPDELLPLGIRFWVALAQSG